MATDNQLYEHMNSSRKKNLHNCHSDTGYTVKIMSQCLMKPHTLKTYGGVEISLQYPICIPCRPHSCYIPCPSHLLSLDHSNCIWRGVQVMKLLIMQFPSVSRHFISPRSKYSPQHPVPKHLQSMFLP
jgi:hypothetical protein